MFAIGCHGLLSIFAYSTGDVGIRLKDGKKVRPLSTMGAPISVILGNRHQRSVADFLKRPGKLLEIAGVPTRRFEFRLVSLLVILACMSFFVFVLGS
jgi:hypothetical protein